MAVPAAVAVVVVALVALITLVVLLVARRIFSHKTCLLCLVAVRLRCFVFLLVGDD